MGRAQVRYFDPSGRRPADLDGLAVPAWACRVIQAHGSAGTIAVGAWLARDTGILSLGQQSGKCR